MGICFTTRGWTGAQVVVTSAAGNDTYAVTGDVLNAGDVATAFRAWLDNIARPWSGLISYVELTVIDDGAGRLAFDFATDDEVNVAGGNSAWRNRIAVMNSAYDTAPHGTTRGSCSAVPGTVMWERWDTEVGGRNRAGSWRTGHPTLSPRRPEVELAFDRDQAYAFNEALRLASAPRTAYLYDEVLSDYRLVTVGKADLRAHKDDDPTKIVGTLEVLGLVA